MRSSTAVETQIRNIYGVYTFTIYMCSNKIVHIVNSFIQTDRRTDIATGLHITMTKFYKLWYTAYWDNLREYADEYWACIMCTTHV